MKKSPSIWELMQWTRAGFNYVEMIGYSKTQTGKLPQSWSKESTRFQNWQRPK